MPNYNAYDTTDGGSDYDDDPSPELITTPYAAFEGELAAVFGTESQFGQSLGIAFENIEVTDGCLYVDPEKEKFKLFSWKKANDMSPQERFDRGEEPSVDDANDFMRKSYAGNDKEYELVAARISEVEDDDGNVIVESASKTRQVTFEGDGEVSFTDYEYLDGDIIPFGDVIMWYNGSTENGPSVSARSLAETLTEYGENAVDDEDDLYNWLNDATGSNVARDDFAGERVRFFTVSREGEDYTYNLPIVEDLSTGSRIQPNNRVADDDSESGDVPDSASYAEPVADFISSGERLDLDEDRAESLLTDLVNDADNSLTEELVEDAGGRDALVQQVV